MPRTSNLFRSGKCLNLFLALLLLLTAMPAVAKDGKAIPDTTKMSAIQLMAWRAQYYKASQDEVEESAMLPDGVIRLTNTPANERCPVWSPDGRYIYCSYTKGTVNCINRIELATGEITAVTDSIFFAQMPDISPDGKYMSFTQKVMGSGTKIWVRRLEDGMTGKLTSSEGINRETWSRWSHDGMKIYFLDSAMSPRMARPSEIMRNGDNQKIILETTDSITRPNVSCAGDRIAWTLHTGEESIIHLINLNITAIYEDIIIPGYHIVCADWLPGDMQMVVIYMERTDLGVNFNMGLLDLNTRELTPLLDSDTNVNEPQVSPDGSQVVFQANLDGMQTDILLLDLQ